MHSWIRLGAFALLAGAGVAHATEGGGSTYANGVENFLVGAVPPPGLYGTVYVNHYEADRMNGADGRSLGIPGFRVRAHAVVPRLIWVTEKKVLGGQLVAHMLAPLMQVEFQAMGQSQRKSGLGDVTVGAALGYHHSPHLHSAIALDVTLPTGRYNAQHQANLGRNYLTVEPVYALSYVNPRGLNGDVRMGYLINQRNKDTDYASGNEFHLDYAAGWGLGNGWTLGVGGYYRYQLESDRQGGVKLLGSKTRGLAVGPNVKYDSGKGWFVTAKWQVEQGVRNGTEGQALWVKAVFPL